MQTPRSSSALRTLSADFDVIDDVLGRVRQARLSSSLELIETDRIGPLVELALASFSNPTGYPKINVRGNRNRQLRAAVENHCLSGSELGSIFGVFPLALQQSSPGQWDSWCLRLQHAAERSGFPKSFAQGIAAAVGELVDNVGEHSRRIESGIAAFAAGAKSIEFVVADAGIGVLDSLRQNPDFANLRDSGEALREAAKDGVSSISTASGRGYGIGQLFRALAGWDGEVRFRSGDHSLTIRGDSLSLSGGLEIAQRPVFDGLTISILCRNQS